MNEFTNFKSKAVKFLKENRWALTRIGLAVATVVILPDSVNYAQSGTTDDTISVITQPLSRMENLMSGPVPKAIVTIGVPRSAIMVNALIAFLFIINFHFWYILPVSLLFHFGCIYVARSDDQFFDCLKTYQSKKNYYCT